MEMALSDPTESPVKKTGTIETKLERISLSDNPDPVDSTPPPIKNNLSPSPKLAAEEIKPTDRSPPDIKTETSAATALTTCDVPPNEADRAFTGELTTSNTLPSQSTIDKIGDYIVLDRHGRTHPFKSLYTGKNVARRVLVVFIRHFFCGNCQEYLRSLSEAITPDALLRLPISTFIAVVGCGDPHLIDDYATETGCPFPIYTDPTRRLYEELGMCRTLAMGPKPAYVRRSFAHTIATGVTQGLRNVKKGLAFKSGDQKQVGGEFLFEPFTLSSPLDDDPHHRHLVSPVSMSRKLSVGFNSLGDGTKRDEVRKERNGIEEKRVSWCHRMRTTRDHAEIPELMEVLGLDELEGGIDGPLGVDLKRWSKAKEERKGTGLSLASEMTRMSKELEPINFDSK